MVGHTHCDMDGCFAKIWKKIRGEHVLTPQAYELMIHSALKSKKHSTNVQDIWVVPDYTKLIVPIIDAKFAR